MKRFVCLICVCWMFVSTYAQTSSLQISTDKTTSLIFPFPIRHVDRGTKDVLVQPVKEADNILLVKAASVKFPETNLSVVTGDGSVYSFKVNYTDQPENWIFYLPELKKSTIATYANGILDNHRTVRGIRDRKWNIAASVNGIYIKDDVMYFQILLCNQSTIDYDIELLKFYIRDKKKSKRTAAQENELKPLHISGNTKKVKACDFSMIVVALDKFTIPDAKSLSIQLMEKSGGRHLLMKVNNNKIIQAIPLPDLK
ncbi:MAG: conjugative transposon protein TraN [Bacteroidetes bacterium]|nr:conjugative transposon protein TraN [Bacteroidota bacterium]